MWRKIFHRVIALKWMHALFCWGKDRHCSENGWQRTHLSYKIKPYLITQLCTLSVSSRLILSHHSLYFNYRHTNADLCKVLLQVIEWEPTVLFMCPCMRLRWFTTTLWKCQGTVHATLAMHTEKVQSLHQAQGSTLWRGMFLFWKFWPTSSHASANMLNIETHNHKEDLRGWQTTLRLFKTAPFQQRKMRMNMAGWTCPPATHTHTHTWAVYGWLVGFTWRLCWSALVSI